jgi:ribosomal protein S1
VLNVGDEVENARVVAIDRDKKRVTLSLRSEDQNAVKSSQKGKTTTDAATDLAKQKEEKTPLLSNKTEEEILPVASLSGNNQVTEAKSFSPSSGQKTGADLKRERKLARRAARRALHNDS